MGTLCKSGFMKILSLIVILMALFPCNSWAAFSFGKGQYQFTKVSSGHQTLWSLEFLSEYEILMSEKEGKIKLLDLRTKKVRSLNQAPHSVVRGQGGLLDLALSPQFKKDRQVFATYAKEVPGGYTTALAKARWEGQDFSSWKEIFVAVATNNGGIHFGSRITFDDQNYLFMSVGERGQRDKAQDLNFHNGSILRMKLDGESPKDNPFIDKKKAKKEIWSYGHRNPQGLFFDKIHNLIIESEHGPRGGDEINIIQKGKNYGWPIITYGKEYADGAKIGEGTHKKGIVDPIHQFTPSIAPSSILVYHGKKLKDFDNHVLVSALAHRKIAIFKFGQPSSMKIIASSLKERIRDVIQGPDELIYFSTDSGSVFRIEPYRSQK